MSRKARRPFEEMDTNILTFPMRDNVLPTESGQGYALRMAADNHLMGMPQVKQLLGKSRFAVLDSDDAHLLSRWFGADEEKLRFALGRLATGDGTSGCKYAGQDLGRSYFVNRSYPRVCVACLEERGICEIAWDISLVVACERHGAPLSDRCNFCSRRLSWNRPTVNVCACGAPIQKEETTHSATGLERQFAKWVHSKVEINTGLIEGMTEMPDDCEALIKLIKPLSLDGGLHIAYALATVGNYEQSLSDKAQAKERMLYAKEPLQKARQVLRRADAVADKILHGYRPQLRIGRPSVVVDLLAQSAEALSSPEDRSLAQSLLATVLNRSRSKWSGVHPQLSQLSLF